MFLRIVVILPINTMRFRRSAALFILRLHYISASVFVVY